MLEALARFFQDSRSLGSSLTLQGCIPQTRPPFGVVSRPGGLLAPAGLVSETLAWELQGCAVADGALGEGRMPLSH